MTAERSVLMVAEPTIAGVAQCVADWAAGLTSTGWRVTLACPSRGWLAGACRAMGVTVLPWEATGQAHRGLPGEARQFHAAVAESQPDVVFLNGAKAGFVGRWYLRGRIPTAFSPHSWAFEAASGRKAALGLRWEQFATRWTDVIIAVSEAEADAGRGLGINAAYRIARNGIDLSQVIPRADRGALRARMGIPDDEVAVVCVGRMHRQKGQDVLVAAWPDVAEPDRRLYFIGDGPLLAETAASTSRPDVVFVGEADRAQSMAWLQAADVVVVPSRWEGMALVPLESLALGTPVIASDVTGIREAVASPDFGVLVPPESTAGLARALNDWIANYSNQSSTEKARSRARRRQWIESGFGIDVTLQVIDGSLTELVNGSVRRKGAHH